VSSASPARRSTSGVFFEEDPCNDQVNVQERNNVERERETNERERQREFPL